jgi:hypothetical protein
MLKLSRPVSLLFAAAAVLPLVGCAHGKNKADTAYVARDVSSLYTAAKKAMDQGDYEQGAKLFDEVERQHPYSTWARRAQLMSAFNYYLARKYTDAISSAQRFVTIHPGASRSSAIFFAASIAPAFGASLKKIAATLFPGSFANGLAATASPISLAVLTITSTCFPMCVASAASSSRFTKASPFALVKSRLPLAMKVRGEPSSSFDAMLLRSSILSWRPPTLTARRSAT